MQDDNELKPISPPSPDQKPDISATSETLPPSALAQLERVAIETAAFAQKAFPGLKIHR